MSENSLANDLMIVYVAYNEPEAHIVAGRLTSEGIFAYVHRDPLGNAYGLSIGPLGEVKVAVRATDYERALAILDHDVEDEDEGVLDDYDDNFEDDDELDEYEADDDDQ